jgi:transaldolase
MPTSSKHVRCGQSLADVGVDMDDVAAQLERDGVDSFATAFDELIAALDAKSADLV